MDSLTTGKGCRLGFVLLILSLVLCTGCVHSFGPLVPAADIPPPGVVCQVVATWHNQVAWTPDPVRNGQPTPGLAGRVYLFGPQIDYPLVGDGSIVVDLYDLAPTAAGSPPVLLEQWRFDRDTLKRLLRRDPIGWGYTLFLPWGTYRPDIARVQLRLRYDPAAGAPLFAESSPLTLGPDERAAQALFGHANAGPAGTGTAHGNPAGRAAPASAPAPQGPGVSTSPPAPAPMSAGHAAGRRAGGTAPVQGGVRSVLHNGRPGQPAR